MLDNTQLQMNLYFVWKLSDKREKLGTVDHCLYLNNVVWGCVRQYSHNALEKRNGSFEIWIIRKWYEAWSAVNNWDSAGNDISAFFDGDKAIKHVEDTITRLLTDTFPNATLHFDQTNIKWDAELPVFDRVHEHQKRSRNI
jgi:hypothetical protein